MRVDGIQSVPTCAVRVREGMVCETQNVVGSADADLLSVTDWFFKDGLDHHHMFTRFGPINRIMQKVARRIAGVGTLPDVIPEVAEVAVQHVDVVVIGAGRSGLRLASLVAEKGPRVLVIDERDGPRRTAKRELVRARAAGVDVRFGLSALGVYERSILGYDGRRCCVLRAKSIVFATGTHEHVPAIRGVDHPGVVTASAAERLLEEGFSPGKNVLVAYRELEDARVICERLAANKVRVGVEAASDLVRIRGGSHVESVEHASGQTTETDCVVFAGFESGVYELAVQVGASTRFSDDGFWVQTDSVGRIVPGPMYAVGSCAQSRRTATDARVECVADSLLGELT